MSPTDLCDLAVAAPATTTCGSAVLDVPAATELPSVGRRVVEQRSERLAAPEAVLDSSAIGLLDRRGVAVQPERIPGHDASVRSADGFARYRRRARQARTMRVVATALVLGAGILLGFQVPLLPGRIGGKRADLLVDLGVELTVVAGLLGLCALIATTVLPSRARSLRVALGLRRVARRPGVTPRPIAAPRTAFVVDEVRTERPGLITVALAPARPDERRQAGRPGQFAWLRVDSAWGRLLPIPFTVIASDLASTTTTDTVTDTTDMTSAVPSAAPGRGRRLHLALRAADADVISAELFPGRIVHVDGPHGSFDVDRHAAGASSLLLIAEGLGVTPMISILHVLAARRDPRPICLVVGARSPEDLLFREELAQLRQELDLDLVEIVSRPTPTWPGMSGRIDGDLLEIVLGARRGRVGSQVHLCGPASMVADVHAALVRLGAAPHHVRTEPFDLV
jgi:NAD(P)H-flavin reductase